MSQDPYGQQPPYQPPHPNAPMHPAIQYAPVPTQKPEPTTVVKIGTYLIYAVALYMIMRAIVGLDDFGFQTYHTENGKTTEVNSSTGLGYAISAIFAGFTILLGFFYSKGHGWARITALVLGIIGTIRDLLYFLLTLLAQSLVQSVTSQMDGAQQVSISPAVYIVLILGIILQIAVVVFMLRGDAARYTSDSRLWRSYRQDQGPQPVQQPTDSQPQQGFGQAVQNPQAQNPQSWSNPAPQNPNDRYDGGSDGYRLN